MFTRFSRVVTAASVLGLLVTVAGCSGESASTNGADTTDTVRAKDTVAASTPDPLAHGPMHGGHFGGPDFLLVAALHEPTLGLTDAQKTTIQGAIDASRPTGPQGFDKTRVTALAAGIRAGKVDATSLAPSTQSMATHQAASAQALTTLHATLTADQRKALVDAVAAHLAAGPKDGLHKDHAGPPKGDLGPMGHMLEGLDLTQAQQDAIKAKMDAQRPTDADRATMQAQHDAFRAQLQTRLQTFTSDSFDAAAFVTPPQGALKPGDHADRFASDLAIITSVLEPAQREKLAVKIEAGPQLHLQPMDVQP